MSRLAAHSKANTRAKQAKVKGAPSVLHWRLLVVVSAITLVFIGLGIRAAYIQIISPDLLIQRGDNRTLRTRVNPLHRGLIVDRNGQQLAVSVPVRAIWADPKAIADAMLDAEQKASEDPSFDLKAKLRENKKRWKALAEILGQDLRRIVDEARQLKRVLDAFPTHYPRHILEQAAIAGAFVQGAVDADLQGVADKVAKRLDLIALEWERGWSGRITQDKGMRLARILRGVEEVRTMDGNMLRSGEARRTGTFTQSLQDVYSLPATLIRKDKTQLIHGPLDLLEAILTEGEKGLSLQRYKGLGEMNPDQLWETTLDPDARTLLQVKVEDLADADDLFTKLMGDVVEPRREFIQNNALNVENLDF